MKMLSWPGVFSCFLAVSLALFLSAAFSHATADEKSRDAAPEEQDGFRFLFGECDFSHRSIYSRGDGRLMPFLNDPLLVGALLLLGARVDEEERYLELPLFYSGNAEVTHALLAAGADVNAKRGNGRTPLFYAPDGDSVRMLVAAGADVNTEDDHLFTPIFTALNADVVEALLEAGAKLTHYTGQTPLHTARDAGVVERLVKAGVDVNEKTLVGEYPPLAFARDGEVAQALIKAGADPLYKTQTGETLLFFARDADTVRQLIEAGVDVNAVSEDQNTALNACAAYDGYSDEGRIALPKAIRTYHFGLETGMNEAFLPAELLIKAGADVNHRGVADRTPILLAYDPQLVKLLVESGADVKFQSGVSGESALHIHQKPESLRLLLEAGANVHALDMKGRSALFHVQDAEKLQILLEAGALVTQRDAEGETPLHGKHAPESIRILVAAGADPFAKNKSGQMPLDEHHWANSLAALIDVMREAGADPKVFLNEPRGNDEFIAFQLISLHNYFSFDREKQEFSTRRSRWSKSHDDLDYSDLGNLKVLLEAGMDTNLVNDKGRTILYRVLDGEMAELLLKHGADVSATDTRGNTPLHAMLYRGAETDAVKAVLDAGADVNAESEDGIPPLLAFYEQKCSESYDPSDNHRFWFSGETGREERPETVKLLLAARAKTDVKNEDEQTALHILREPDSLRALLEAGADVNAKDKRGRTPLFTKTDEEAARVLVEAGADVNAKNDAGKTVLQEMKEHPEVAAILRKAGAEETADDEEQDVKHLFMVMYSGKFKNLKQLAEGGADLRVVNAEGHTLLHWADSPEIMRFLLEKGLDVHARDLNGNTPLHTLMSDYITMDHCSYGRPANPPCVRVLLEAGADVNAKNKDGRAPLHMSGHRGDARVMALLLAAGADVNARDVEGNTPLLLVARDLMMYQLLLKAGANIHAKDHAGNTFLHKVVQGFYWYHDEDYSEIKMAIAHGLDVNAINGKMETPLHLCATHEEIVKILMAAGADPHRKDIDGRDALQKGTSQTRKIMQGESLNNEDEEDDPWMVQHIILQ